MANRLDISASYLNLLERNRLPVSARVMVKLVEVFAFDPRSLREDERIGGVDGKPFVEWDIMGSEGRIRIGNNVLDLSKLSGGGGRTEMVSYQFPQRYVAKSPRVAIIEEIAACLRGERDSISNGADGRASMEISMAFYESDET